MLSRQPALRIPLAASLVFLAFSLLYLRDVPALRVSFWGFGAGLLIFLFWLYRTSARDGRLLHFEFVPRSTTTSRRRSNSPSTHTGAGTGVRCTTKQV